MVSSAYRGGLRSVSTSLTGLHPSIPCSRTCLCFAGGSGILCSPRGLPAHSRDLVSSQLGPLRCRALTQLRLRAWTVGRAAVARRCQVPHPLSRAVPSRDGNLVFPLPCPLLSRPGSQAGQWCSQTSWLDLRAPHPAFPALHTLWRLCLLQPQSSRGSWRVLQLWLG